MDGMLSQDEINALLNGVDLPADDNSNSNSNSKRISMFYLGNDDRTCKLVEYSSVSVKDASHRHWRQVLDKNR